MDEPLTRADLEAALAPLLEAEQEEIGAAVGRDKELAAERARREQAARDVKGRAGTRRNSHRAGTPGAPNRLGGGDRLARPTSKQVGQGRPAHQSYRAGTPGAPSGDWQ